MLGSGRPVPFEYLFDVSDASGQSFRLLRARGPDGIVGGLLLGIKPGPVLPGHSVVRVERLGTTLPPTATRSALAYLRATMDADPRVLRCTVNLFTPGAELRDDIETALHTAGFRPWDHVDRYLHTLVMNLERPIEEVFAGLHRSARRNVRQLAKKPVELRVIEDPGLAPRMHQLAEETYRRTGGSYHPLPLDRLVAESANLPDRSRFVGLFRDDVPDEAQALVAFAWGRGHGDHGEYSVGASTTDLDLRIPVGYPLLWDLVVWAKGWGASWFDLGGVTSGEGEDPLAGVSDFKRFFSTELRTVGGTWILPPRSLRARLVQSLHPAVVGLKGSLEARGVR